MASRPLDNPVHPASFMSRAPRALRSAAALIGAGACAALTALALVGCGSSSAGTAASDGAAPVAFAQGSDVVIDAAAVGEQASLYRYDAAGTTVELFAVRASDGSVRVAFNTCQVCNGSPYAFFEQKGDSFICQNCGNAFATAQVGIESGGCNPVPVTAADYTVAGDTITVPAAFIEENAWRFNNWKQF